MERAIAPFRVLAVVDRLVFWHVLPPFGYRTAGRYCRSGDAVTGSAGTQSIEDASRHVLR